MKSVAPLIGWRDLRATLSGMAGYGMLAGFLALTGWSFAELLRRNEGGFVSAQAIWGMAIAPWLPVLAAAATMRLFAEERQTGTLETLLTAPVRAGDLVLGKFLAAYSMVATGILLALVQVWALRQMAPRMDGDFSAVGLLAATVLYCVAHAAFPSERKSLSWQDNPIT